MVFKKLFGKFTNSKANSPLPLSAGIAESILSAVGSRSIPAMPSAAQKAFELSTNPKADARDFVEVIESDEALSARLLRVANSVYFDRGKASKSIEEAVLVVGINEVRSLLSANSLTELFPSRHTSRAQLWKNDVACGIFARMLAQRVMQEKADLAFLGGLMHDVGKLLLLQRRQDDYPAILVKGGASGDFIKAEEDVFLFNHTHVGQLIGERWRFSPELLGIIAQHHSPWNEIEGSVAAVVRVADLISHALGIGHPKGYAAIQEAARQELPEGLHAINISFENLKVFLEESEKIYQLEQDRYQSQ